jgi:uncharacterized protein YchJ
MSGIFSICPCQKTACLKQIIKAKEIKIGMMQLKGNQHSNMSAFLLQYIKYLRKTSHSVKHGLTGQIGQIKDSSKSFVTVATN